MNSSKNRFLTRWCTNTNTHMDLCYLQDQSSGCNLSISVCFILGNITVNSFDFCVTTKLSGIGFDPLQVNSPAAAEHQSPSTAVKLPSLLDHTEQSSQAGLLYFTFLPDFYLDIVAMSAVCALIGCNCDCTGI